MTLVNQLFLFTAALWNLLVRIIYLPFAILASIFTVLQQWRAILGLLLVGGAFFIAAQYTGPVVDTVEFTFRCRINPFYNETIRPILAGIVREFFNRIVCWYNAFLWYPYGLGRRVIFPILRDGGFGTAVTALARFFSALADDIVVKYILTGDVFSNELNLDASCTAWQTFWEAWQNLLCYGCNDLCPYFTKLPVIPAFFGSDQIKDRQWWIFMEKSLNGVIHILQRVIYVIREIIWPTDPVRPRFEFKRAFELWCEASTAFWKSWENAMQRVWDNFVPYDFIWKDVLCFFDKITCAALRLVYWTVNLIVNADQVLLHFAGRDSTFWTSQVKQDFKEVINTLAPASTFAAISEALPVGGPVVNMTIFPYTLLSGEEANPETGKVNPLFNQSTAGECFCLAITRVLCDPLNNGTTCEQQFNGTLLSGIDPCCFVNEPFILLADVTSFLFEFTLHFRSANDFFLFLDRQPFTSLIKRDIVRFNACVAQVFLSIKTYGGCLQVIVAQLADFVICSAELAVRIVIAIITLPYFQAFLPGYCNFITCPGPNNALDQTLEFINRIGDTSDPNGLINCMCFTLNTGFNVPYAGCNNVTCQPVGFVPPTDPMLMTRSVFQDSIYNLTSPTGEHAHRLTPIMTYGKDTIPNSWQFSTRWSDYQGAGDAFLGSYRLLDESLERFSKDSRCSAAAARANNVPGGLTGLNITNVLVNCTDPMNPTPNPPPCFNLCCLPTKIIQLSTHTVATIARSVNAAFQAQFGPNGSTYWTGEACMMGQDCFQSDATTLVIRLIAPVECLCEFIKLVLPPQGFGDPCCGITKFAELVSCIVQIIINVGNSVGGDAPNFTYIRDPKFLRNDFDIVLDLALQLFDCLCNFIRTIFQVAFRGNDLARAFDPCCIFRVWFRAILEVLRVGFRILLALATQKDSEESRCYLYVNGYNNSRPGCPQSVADLNITKDFRRITQILLAPPISNANVVKNCAVTQDFDMFSVDREGLPTCLCRFVNALLALVYQITTTGGFTGSYDMAPACTINLCCIIYKFGLVYYEVLNFLAQLVASLWQNWEFREIMGEKFFLPQETLYFVFCNEYGNSPFIPGTMNVNPIFYGNTDPSASLVSNGGQEGIINPNSTNPNVASTKCGAIEPALQALHDLLGGCLCIEQPQTNQTLSSMSGETVQSGIGLANVLDDLVRWLVYFVTQSSSIFPYQLVWPRCFCKGGPDPDPNRQGIVKPAANAIVTLVRQVIVTVRNIANPSFWTFQGITLSDESQSEALAGALTDNYNDLRKTWVNRFIAPFADAMCSLVTNLGCVLSIILGETCSPSRYRFLSSATRYYFEALIRVVSLVEGFVKLFTQEPPGLCVGDKETTQGNIPRPGEQGTTGQTGDLIPTCSPRSEREERGIRDGQLSRLLTASLAFAVDALIGIGRFGCSTICPGFDPSAVTPFQFTYGAPGLPPRPADGTIISQQSVCDCWNKSPYLGIQSGATSVCGFGLCDRYYNSGNGNFKCPGLGGTDQACPNTEAKMPPNTGLAATQQEQNELEGNNYCQACVNDTNVVGFNDQIFEAPNARSWEDAYPQHRFRPIALEFQPFGLACQVVTQLGYAALNVDPAAFNLLQSTIGENLLTPVSIASLGFPGVFDAPGSFPDVIWPIGSPFTQPTVENFCNVNPFTDSDPILFREAGAFGSLNKPWYPGACAVYQLCETPGFRNTLSGFGTILYDGICTRGGTALGPFGRRALAQTSVSSSGTPLDAEFGTSIAQNMCQLCVMAIQNRTTFDGTKYPANIQHVCDRSYCIIEKPMCKNDQMVPCRPGEPILDGVIITLLKYFDCLLQTLFGNFPAFLMRSILLFLSIVWQLSGGIIRLVVAIVFVVWNFFSKPFIIAVTQFIPSIISVLRAFGAIFVQPIALGYKREELSDPIMAQVKVLYSFDDAHTCIDAADAVTCFCRAVDMMPLCGINRTTGLVHPSNLTTTDVLMYLRDHFNGETNCDMLLHDLVNANPSTWLEIDYARRYELVECVTQRSKGESFNRNSGGMLPPDFFYNPKAWYKVLEHAFHEGKRTILGGNETHRKESADNFKRAFKVERDSYYHMLNSRGRLVKRYYQEELGITEENSPVFNVMLRLDMHQFMWHSGYYNYLYHESSWKNFEEKIPNFSQSIQEVRDATDELMTKSQVIYDKHRPEIQRFVDRYVPPTPPLIKSAWDGTLWQGIKDAFPMLYWPSIRFNPPVFEDASILPGKEPRWTPRKESNIEAGWRILYSASHLLWPHHTSREVHERFILNGSCLIADGAVNLAAEMVDYCLNEFRENIPTLRDSALSTYLDQTSHLRRDGFHGRFAKHELRWETTGSGNWSRPKIDYIPLEARTKVHHRLYNRAVPRESLIGKLLLWVGNLFGIDLFQTLDNFLADLQNFAQNPNTNIKDYPDVGARYWGTFLLRCEFPENLNCSIGIGLGAALVRVGIIYLIVFAVLAFVFPQLLSFLSFLVNILLYILIVAIVAWHYSPACLVLFPASELSQIGITIPVLPIPVSIFPTLPECLWDDIIRILDDIFAMCYEWIPLAWINGPSQCATCDNRLGFINCVDVGISTPIESLVYWGERIFGSVWCDIMRGISTSVAFSWIPFFTMQVADTCDLIATASETQMERMQFCGYLSIGSLAWLVLGLYIAGIFLLAIVPALLNIGHGTLLLLPTLPWYDAVVGLGEEQGSFVIDGEGGYDEFDEEEEEQEEPIAVRYVRSPQPGIGDYIASGFRRAFMSHQKTE